MFKPQSPTHFKLFLGLDSLCQYVNIEPTAKGDNPSANLLPSAVGHV
jgi:hypothetical protein